MKRLSSIIVAIAMVLTFVPFAVTDTLAAGTLTIVADTSEVGELSPGDTFEVPIKITENPGFCITAINVTLSPELQWNVNGTYSTTPNAAGKATWPFITGDVDVLTPTVATVNAAVANDVNRLFRFAFLQGGVSKYDIDDSDITMITLKLKVLDTATEGATYNIGLEFDGGSKTLTASSVQVDALSATGNTVTMAGDPPPVPVVDPASITWPVVEGTVDQPLSSIVLGSFIAKDEDEEDVAGKFVWVDGTALIADGENAVAVKFVPDNAAIEPVDGTATVTGIPVVPFSDITFKLVAPAQVSKGQAFSVNLNVLVPENAKFTSINDLGITLGAGLEWANPTYYEAGSLIDGDIRVLNQAVQNGSTALFSVDSKADAIDANGTLLKLNLKAANNASGDISITLSGGDDVVTLFANGSDTSLKAVFNNASVSVSSTVLWGDANSTGSVTVDDINMMRAYIASNDRANFAAAGWNFYLADVNQDQKVNSTDVTRLRHFIAAGDYGNPENPVVLGPDVVLIGLN